MEQPTESQPATAPSNETLATMLRDFAEDNRKSDLLSFADFDLLHLAADRLSAIVKP